MNNGTPVWLHPHTALRVGGWLPTDHRAIRSFLTELNADVEAGPEEALLPPVQELANVIEQNPTTYCPGIWPGYLHGGCWP